MTKLDLSIRQNVFYWQTDREITPEDFDRIFLKRHRIQDEELLHILKRGIQSIQIETIELIPADENVVKGNVNVVRKIIINGNNYVVRMHPKEVKNGYFYVEKLLLDKAKEYSLPVPQILEIHEATNDDDMDFILMTTASGVTMDVYLSKDQSHEENLLINAGKTLAKVHEIKVNGFGPFDNKKAKENILIGLHATNKEFMMTALEENFQRLIKLSVRTHEEVETMKKIMNSYSFEPENGSRLIHNDFADWNLLTDGDTVTAILDWDEACGGDPIADLACWSMFFDLERYKAFLRGYTSVSKLPEDYELRFHYYRLRYAISKMALRAKRAIVDTSDFAKSKLEVGKVALAEEMKWFKNL